MPSGASDVCGSSPRRRATSLALKSWIDLPSSTTSPALGFSSRESPRSSVDLPHALGPTMTVNERSGISTSRCSLMTRPSYPIVASRASSRAPSIVTASGATEDDERDEGDGDAAAPSAIALPVIVAPPMAMSDIATCSPPPAVGAGVAPSRAVVGGVSLRVMRHASSLESVAR